MALPTNLTTRHDFWFLMIIEDELGQFYHGNILLVHAMYDIDRIDVKSLIKQQSE